MGNDVYKRQEWNTILQEQTIQAYKEDDYINADNKTEFF